MWIPGIRCNCASPEVPETTESIIKIATKAIHAGYETESTTKSVAVPIYQTVAYEFDDAQHAADLFNLEVEGNIYSRIMNPTNAVLERRVTELEGGAAGLAVSAGSAAINYAILTIAEQGNNIVTVPQLYGGTYTLFGHMLGRLGIEARFARDDSPAALEALARVDRCDDPQRSARSATATRTPARVRRAHPPTRPRSSRRGH